MSFMDRFSSPKTLPPGTYRFDGKGDLAYHRFHLRVDSQRKGVLMVDASKLLFLNGTAIDLVRCILEGYDEAETVRYMRGIYKKLKKDKVVEDLGSTRKRLSAFIEGDTSVIDHMLQRDRINFDRFSNTKILFFE